MNLEWLRELSLADRPGDLKKTLERIATTLVQGEAVFFDYDSDGWALTRDNQRIGLEQSNLAALCAVGGSAVNETNQALLAEGQSWPHVAGLPVRRFGSLSGVLLVGSAGELPLEKLNSLGEGFALVLEPLQELDQTQQALGQFRDLTVAAVESCEGILPGHVAGVCQLTADLAEYLDLSPQARKRLWMAAMYHDAGQVLLSGHGSAEAIRSHPQRGSQFLEASGVYRELAPLVATHHERYDGTGFPEGLKGDALTIDQWVLCLAEDFQEFLELNPHLGLDVKISIFFQEKSALHHPDVLDALAGLVDSGRLDRLRTKN